MKKDKIISRFQEIAGNENVLVEPADLATYAYDAAVLEPTPPMAVVQPPHTENLGPIIEVCNAEKIPITVRGAGTNLSGGTIPHRNGIVLLTNGLNKIKEVNTADLYAVVEPGVITAKLAAAAEEKGLFYPPDPGSMAVSTIGGNVSENAGGLRGLKYGVTRDYVMGLTFFASDGTLVKTGSRTVKCASGYNLSGLMVGSEGTLGVFSEIILKLIPKPSHQKAMMAIYDRLSGASETVSAIIAGKIVPATLEFLDNFTIRAVEKYAKAGLPTDAAALLLIEVDGHPSQVEEEEEKIKQICLSNGAKNVKTARDAAERDAVWSARRSALSALAQLKPTVVLEDATVPRSNIPAMVAAIEEISKRRNISIGVFGHAGDGNLHPTILTDKRDRLEWKRVEAAIDDIFEKALALNGTLSGEHGTGIAKSRYLKDEVGQGTILWSKRMKTALDPNRIFNPGKITGD